VTAATLTPIAEARARVLDAVRPLPAESVPVLEAIDRVLAQDVIAVGDTPPFDCSAMDGYAVVAGSAGRRLALVAESRAGTPSGHTLQAGEAIRISTGAAIPGGATAVIRQEDTTLHESGGIVELLQAAPPGNNIRGAGEDLRAGTIVLTGGSRLGPIELGVAVAAGAGELAVARRPRVSVLTTGDELRAPGEPLAPGEIHNSNGPMLTGLAARCGGLVGPARGLPDDLDATIAGIGDALTHSDVVIISGGVSVGPHDHVKPALAALGVREVFWAVALQPGKPTWFGVTDDDRLVFGLPGNPVSVVVTFSLFVAPALAALQCAPQPRPPHAQAQLGALVARNPGRDQMIRVTLRAAPDGPPVARPTGAQASHILSSLLDADALARIPAGHGHLVPGTLVELHALVR
jgi:molybdopterin molybdotransferase